MAKSFENQIKDIEQKAADEKRELTSEETTQIAELNAKIEARNSSSEKTKKVKVKLPLSGKFKLAHRPGQEAEFEAKLADEMIEAGYAVEVK